MTAEHHGPDEHSPIEHAYTPPDAERTGPRRLAERRVLNYLGPDIVVRGTIGTGPDGAPWSAAHIPDW